MNANFSNMCASIMVAVMLLASPLAVSARSGCCSSHGGVCAISCCDGSPLSAACGGSSTYTPPTYVAPSIPVVTCPTFSHYNGSSGVCDCDDGYTGSNGTCETWNAYCFRTWGNDAFYDQNTNSCACTNGPCAPAQTSTPETAPAHEPDHTPPVTTPEPHVPTTTIKRFSLPKRSKTSGCIANGALQDADCTPGAIFAVTEKQICKPGYSKSVRNVPKKTKNQVFAEYGIARHVTGEYEVDHLISLELGGSNDIANLWPEAAMPKPGFHEKDKVENYLHRQVCKGLMTLKKAQEIISTDWLQVYQLAK